MTCWLEFLDNCAASADVIGAVSALTAVGAADAALASTGLARHESRDSRRRPPRQLVACAEQARCALFLIICMPTVLTSVKN